MPFTEWEDRSRFEGELSNSSLDMLSSRYLLDFQMELLSKQLKYESESNRRDNW